ncbi:MAG: hypothetical protein ABI462_06570 [Ignavibacteria bacterium]
MGKPKVILTIVFLLFFLYSFNTNSRENKNQNQNSLLSLDAETLNWLERVDSAGGSVSDSTIAAVDDYVKEVKGLKFQSGNIRDLILRENWYCGDFNSAFVPLFRNSDGSSLITGSYKDINHNYSSTGYSDTGLAGGLKGNGTSSYLETGLNPAQTTQLITGDAHLMVFSMSYSNDAGRNGCRNNFGDGFYFYPRYTNGNVYFNINGTVESAVSTPSPNGYILVQRTSPNQTNAYYQNNLLNTFQTNSLYRPNVGVTIGAFNDNGSVSGFLSMRLGGYSIGRSFNYSQELIHYNAVQRLMDRLGRKFLVGNEVDFRSKLFTFTGNKLNINFETRPEGFIQFELQDQNGDPFENFEMEDCPPVSGNSFDYQVSWNSAGDLSSLINTPVYLRIKMKDADLYSLKFADPSMSIDSSQSGIIIGSYKQFFADTLLFGNNIPVIRKMHSPVKLPEPVLSPTEAWEGNLIITTYSNVAYSYSIFLNKNVFKMWLRSNSSTGRLPVYYESEDGINWTRPNLESFKFSGSMNNNILSDAPLSPGVLYTVVDDSVYNNGDPNRRYKSVYNFHTTRENSKLYVSFSSDGLNWVPYSGNPVRHIGEDLSSSGWNPVLQKYLGYFRDSLGIRNVGRYVSADWINWAYTGTILKPDAMDIKTTEFYNMQVLFKDSVYWGFAGHFQMNQNADEEPAVPTRTDNTVFIELLFSRDGINFTRCGNRQPFINYGNTGSWDDEMVYTAGVPVRVGNEFYIYYNGFNFKHMASPPPPADGGPPKSHIGLAKMGVDRFVSLTAF